jgi:arylsulfatase A-like enzyme
MKTNTVISILLLAQSLGWTAERPNIVLIMADDMGYSDIGCYGGEIPTPHLDRLAEDGLRFTQFYNAGRCCPTRASLLTGLYPHEAGIGWMVYRNHGAGYLPFLNKQNVTLAEVMKSAGYQTLMTGKWHVGHTKGKWPTDRGFERFYGIHIHVDSYFKVLGGCPVYHDDKLVIPPTANPPKTLHPDQEWYTTDVFTDWAMKFLDEAEKEKPFFLYVAHNAPHWPIEAPDENVANFKGRYDKGWDALREEKLKRMKVMGLLAKNTELSPHPKIPDWDKVPAETRNESAFRREIYAAQIERLDENIGRLVAKLKDLGKLENTLILFLSDNGCSAEKGIFGWQYPANKRENFKQWRNQSGRSASQGEGWSNASNAPFRKHKRWVHEGGIATPFIAHWPKQIKSRGKLTHQPGHVVDVMSTLVDIAGANYPKTFNGKQIKPAPGKSLMPTFRNPQEVKERTLFWEHETHAAIRQGNWKLVTENATQAEAWELYDMSKNRTETDNVATQMPNRVKGMRKKWGTWARQADVLPWPGKRKK